MEGLDQPLCLQWKLERERERELGDSFIKSHGKGHESDQKKGGSDSSGTYYMKRSVL